jgi:hypothetical protein
MDKKKKSNANFLNIGIFNAGVKENEIKIPRNAIKPVNKLTWKDKANMQLFVIDKEYAEILNSKL